jgi:hypothetical protein
MSQLASPQEAQRFVDKWQGVERSERAASQEHFIDLCNLVRQPTPAQADPTGEDYCFEKPVKVTLAASKGSKGEGGFVDVWKRGCFAWEYKRKDKYKNLDEAYRQLYQYRDALDNPPLSVVCDISTIETRADLFFRARGGSDSATDEGEFAPHEAAVTMRLTGGPLSPIGLSVPVEEFPDRDRGQFAGSDTGRETLLANLFSHGLKLRFQPWFDTHA